MKNTYKTEISRKKHIFRMFLIILRFFNDVKRIPFAVLKQRA